MANAPLTPPPRSLHINDFPDALLAVVAEYLPRPSRAMFATAATAPPSSWRDNHRDRQPSAMGRAIMGSSCAPAPSGGERADRWSVLDFGEVERPLAEKLTDDDLVGILACVMDAINLLRTLRLTSCVNVAGSGLEPLRGSTALELVDLSLAGWHENSFIEPEPTMLSESEVVPILASILEAEGSSLRFVYLTKAWHENPGTELGSFLRACVYTPHPKPKRAMSSFFLYSTANRQDVKSANPTANFGEVARILASQFRALSKDDIAHWNQQAVEDKERYQREMRAFTSGTAMYKIVR